MSKLSENNCLIACARPWDQMFIWDNGDISHCGKTHPIANLHDVNFNTFWNSRSLCEIRNKFVEGSYLDAGCMPGCGTLMSKFNHENAKYFREQYKPPTNNSIPVIFDGLESGNNLSSELDFHSNIEKLNSSLNNGDLVLTHYPTFIGIQLSTYCSLSCPNCCFGIDEKRGRKKKARVLSAEALEKLKPLYPYLTGIGLFGGELFDLPFNNSPLKKILEDIQQSGNKDINVKIVTNGQNFSKKWVDYILGFKFINPISFSVDNVYPGEYEQIRIGGELEKLKKNINYFREKRDGLEREKPEIYLTSLIGLHTYKRIPELIKFAREFGATRVDYQFYNPMGSLDHFNENHIFQDKFRRNVQELEEILYDADFPSNRDDVLRVIDGFLDVHEDINIDRKKSQNLPFISQLNDEVVLPPLIRYRTLYNVIHLTRNFIHSLKLKFATYARSNSCTVHISLHLLKRKNPLIWESTVNADSIEDNQWVTFIINKEVSCTNSYFLLKIESDGSIDNSVSLRSSKNKVLQKSITLINDEAQFSDLAMMLF